METGKTLTVNERKKLLETAKAEQKAKAANTKTDQAPRGVDSAEFQARKANIAAARSGNSVSATISQTGNKADTPTAPKKLNTNNNNAKLAALFAARAPLPESSLQSSTTSKTSASTPPVTAEETASTPIARPRPAFLGAINNLRSSSPETTPVSSAISEVDTSQLSALFANRKPPAHLLSPIIEQRVTPQSIAETITPIKTKTPSNDVAAPSTVSASGLFSATTTSTLVSLDKVTKEKYIAELTTTKKHYGKFLTQGHEAAMNIFSNNKKTTTKNDSRANAKKTIASDLISLLKADVTKDLAARFTTLLDSNHLTTADFFDGKTSEILSSDLIQLLKGENNTPKMHSLSSFKG